MTDWPEQRVGCALLVIFAQLMINESGKRWSAAWVTVLCDSAATPGILVYRAGDAGVVPDVERTWAIDKPFILELEPAILMQQVPALAPDEAGLESSIVVAEDWIVGRAELTPLQNYLNCEYIRVR